ncbi:xanthine dehydrogenase family protein subunit M [Pelagibius litoralis]|uniref:Xanthine dehydrogenase family protein subunit M n=1 Tax=Pelagibius litoralis TaxID=374515 RepID=A0A967KDN6_9PROT|nr:xanthine dehydrogenase family protein subunit M [Pelagibius litoralis]NIA71519.1 xanthine dehydrogenase family protein subunit M [Pelagibius litoralis]
MKPRAFEYVRARSLQDVFSVLDAHGDEAKILAGGQSLVPALNLRLAAPEIVVDVSAVEALSGITVVDDVLRIGAMSRYIEVATSDLVARHAPMIARAIPYIAHTAIRNRGTFGGSLCNADPASELPACALALKAVFNISSSAGERKIAASDFFLGTYTTALEPNEVLVSVEVPLTGPGSLFYFDEVARRQGDYAMAGLAARAEVRGGVLADARLVFFAVSDMPLAASAASALLEGKAPGSFDAEVVCEALAQTIVPLEDLTTSSATKLHLMKVLTRRALTDFAGKEA